MLNKNLEFYGLKSLLELRSSAYWNSICQPLSKARVHPGVGHYHLKVVRVCAADHDRDHDPLFSRQSALPGLLIYHQCAAQCPHFQS